MEILVLLMDEIDADNWKIDKMDQFSENLIQRGYTKHEINTAFYWMHQRFSWDSVVPTHKIELSLPEGTSYRVLNLSEQKYIEPKAFGYLLHIKHLGIITASEMEEIMERIFVFDFKPATLDDVKVLVHSLLFEEGGVEHGNARLSDKLEQDKSYH